MGRDDACVDMISECGVVGVVLGRIVGVGDEACVGECGRSSLACVWVNHLCFVATAGGMKREVVRDVSGFGSLVWYGEVSMSIMVWRMVLRRDVPPQGLMSFASVSILSDLVRSMLAW